MSVEQMANLTAVRKVVSSVAKKDMWTGDYWVGRKAELLGDMRGCSKVEQTVGLWVGCWARLSVNLKADQKAVQ